MSRNLADFMYPYDTKNQNKLAQMTKDASRIIKGNDPKALIGSASVLPRDSSGGMKRASKYLTALKKKDAKNWCGIDFVACHIYPEPGKGAKRFKALLQEVKDTMTEMKLSDERKSGSRRRWPTASSATPSRRRRARILVAKTYEYAGGQVPPLVRVRTTGLERRVRDGSRHSRMGGD